MLEIPVGKFWYTHDTEFNCQFLKELDCPFIYDFRLEQIILFIQFLNSSCLQKKTLQKNPTAIFLYKFNYNGLNKIDME